MEAIADDSIFNSIPDDPEEAFLYLEALFWQEALSTKSNSASERAAINRSYVARVLAIVTELDLDCTLSGRDVPPLPVFTADTLNSFRNDVDAYRTTLLIRSARRRRQYSVALDPTTKDKLRRLLARMREIVDHLDVSDDKKEALFAKINALENEIDKDRTRFEAIGALYIEVCSKAGEGAEKLKPLRELVDSFANLISKITTLGSGAPPRLPQPQKPKQIEGPKPEADTADS